MKEFWRLSKIVVEITRELFRNRRRHNSKTPLSGREKPGTIVPRIRRSCHMFAKLSLSNSSELAKIWPDYAQPVEFPGLRLGKA